jgi:FKBP-type peptidyl-prolyl cis-trans isomerase FklB
LLTNSGYCTKKYFLIRAKMYENRAYFYSPRIAVRLHIRWFSLGWLCYDSAIAPFLSYIKLKRGIQMKLRILVAAMGLAGVVGSQAYAAEPAKPGENKPVLTAVQSSSLTTDKDKLSYAIGMDLGDNFKESSIEVNPVVLGNGVKDALSGGTTLMTSDQRKETLMKFQKEFRAKQEAEMKQVIAKNKQAGDTFLAANKAKPGVTTLPSGLQYKVIETGTGALPADKDTVSVEYEGTLVDGKVFDSSAKQGKSVSFTVGDVIPGWKEALKLMKVGSKWELVIPPALAYGERGAGEVIGPNSVLVFKVKLVSIDAPKAKPTDKPADKKAADVAPKS